MGTFSSTEGWDYGSGFASLPSGKRFLRFGIIAKKTSGGSSTDIENARVKRIIDLKPRQIIQVGTVKSTSTPNFVPLTGAINSTLVRGVMFESRCGCAAGFCD